MRFKKGYGVLMTSIGVLATSIPLIFSKGINVSQKQQPKKPNVIFIFSDEHRYQSMSFTEMPGLVTPNMERLASEGISFQNCISNNPVCVPARAMMMTGRWPYQTGMLENKGQLRSTEMTIGKVFKNADYRTCYIGKWHLGSDLHAEPYGFDRSIIWTQTDKHHESYYHLKDKENVLCKQYNATVMTDQAIEFIESSKDNPFFIMLSINPPHAVFEDAPEEYKKLYPLDKLALRENALKGKRNNERTLNQYQGYNAHITAVDHELGRILDRIKTLGIEDNTVIIYTSDHGSMMGSQGTVNKRHPFSESVKVPFLVKWPGIVPAGIKTEELLGTIDIMPSILGLVGIPVPDTCVGQNLSPVIRGGKYHASNSQFIMHIANKKVRRGATNSAPYFRGVFTREYTYAVGEDGEWLLYDNLKDPYQLNNLIDNENYKQAKQEMRKLLDAWIKKAEDPYLGLDTSLMSEDDRELPLEERIRKASKGASLSLVFRTLNISGEQLYALDETYEDSFIADETGKPTRVDFGIFTKKVADILTNEQYKLFSANRFDNDSAMDD